MKDVTVAMICSLVLVAAILLVTKLKRIPHSSENAPPDKTIAALTEATLLISNINRGMVRDINQLSNAIDLLSSAQTNTSTNNIQWEIPRYVNYDTNYFRTNFSFVFYGGTTIDRDIWHSSRVDVVEVRSDYCPYYYLRLSDEQFHIIKCMFGYGTNEYNAAFLAHGPTNRAK